MQSKASFYLFISKVNSKVLKTKQNSVGILFINHVTPSWSEPKVWSPLSLWLLAVFVLPVLSLFSVVLPTLPWFSSVQKKKTLLLELLIFNYSDWTKFGQTHFFTLILEVFFCHKERGEKREKEAERENLWYQEMRISLLCYDRCQSTSWDQLTSNQ